MNMQKLYKKIAKKYGVSVGEVERDMKEAINSTFIKPNIYAQTISRENEIPTPNEFIKHVAKRVKEMKDVNRNF